MTRYIGMLLLVVLMFPLAPAPINPFCYDDAGYRDTHEQECVINLVLPHSRFSSGGEDLGGGGRKDKASANGLWYHARVAGDRR